MINNKPNWTRGPIIGKGSFGTVNLAVNNSDDTIFAVKSIKQSSGHISDQFSDALNNEIRILKSLSSSGFNSHIVRYLGDDVTSENCFNYRNLHLEYMPRGTVADLDTTVVDDVIVRCYTRCITSALSYIHSRNIVHCDVKGKNVLIGSDPGVVKLADFGSAVEFINGQALVGTRGSPLWMAPEVVRGEYQGPESDVWSLGCTVIEMVTGNPAWQDRGVDTLFQIGFSDELPDLPRHISDELRDFLSKCLKRHRLERWSCDQLLQHPFLLSCGSQLEFVDRKLSPRCVFDWSESNFSDGSISVSETDIDVSNSNSLYAKQRICKLSSGLAANWESDGWEVVRNIVFVTTTPPSKSNLTANWESDGWEAVRNAVATTTSMSLESEFDSKTNSEFDGWEVGTNVLVPTFIQPSESEYTGDEFSISEEEMAVTWPEYSGPVENDDDEEEATIGRSEMTNREYGDSNASFDNDDECTNNHAEGTSSSWNSRDRDDYYSCCVFGSLKKLLLFNCNSSDIFIIQFWFCLMMDQCLINLVSIHYFPSNFLPTSFNEDLI
ncbi:hypothetical protein QVD17_17497 [Tagetes erecta]|uniref:Protein kinase domain-containing protein n=1 Tax=Tagetes erecta TaxID=13708 RepID=A0AAD8P0C7_TARER|nr:hypothetical protein QVD17_17497 [Tagetes erecta]